MARPRLPPSPSSLAPTKIEPDANTTAAGASAHAPLPPIHRKPRRDCSQATPPKPFLTPQTIRSGTSRAGSFWDKRGPTPTTAPATVKREPDDDAGSDAGGRTPFSPPHKKPRVAPVTPIQLLLTPQTIPSGTSRADGSQWSGQPGLTPMTEPASVKREPDTDADADECKGGGRKAVGRLYPYEGPIRAETHILMLNRRRLGHLLQEHARARQWRDAAGVFSALLPASHVRDSFEETRGMFTVGMEIYRRLAGGSGTSRHYSDRTERIYDVWMQQQTLLPASAKKDLVRLELALFHLLQGNIDKAYNATRTLISRKGLQTEPTLNLIHGLISFDKWYSGLPKDMRLQEFDVYSESCTISMASNTSGENSLQDSSDDDCSIDVDDASLPSCSSQSSINNGNIGEKGKISKKSGFVHSVKENGSLDSQVSEEKVDTDFRSVFFNTSDGPICGLEKNLLPLRLNRASGTSNDSFDLYWKYKSTPNTSYEDAERCLRVALQSNSPVMAALLPFIQILLLGDKLKDALGELEKICHSSSTALPFRLRGRLLEYFDQNQVSTISSCYEEALRRDPTCSYSIEKLIKMHSKGYYSVVQLFETIALHLDSVSGKSYIWEELVSCFFRLFSDSPADNEDSISCNVQGDVAITALSNFSSVFFEKHTRETWKLRCKWWMNHHFGQNIYMSETLKGDCKLLASKAACASHLFGPGFQYVKAVESYLSEQAAKDAVEFVCRSAHNSVRLLRNLEKLT